MKTSTKIILTLALAFQLLFPSAAPAQETEQQKYLQEHAQQWTPEQRVYALSSFWMYVKYNFVYMYKIGHERLDSLYQSYLKPTLETKNDYEFCNILTRFCADLKDEHTHIRTPNWQYTTTCFSDDWIIETKYIENKVIVTGISEPKEKEVPLGSEIIELNGLPIRDALTKRAATISASTDHVRMEDAGRWLLGNLIYSKETVKFRRPDGDIRTFTFYNKYEKRYNQLKINRLPALPSNDKFAFKWYPGDIAYLKIGTFMPDSVVENGIERAMPELKKRAKKLIIDIRDNSGGNSGIAASIMSHFITADKAVDGHWYTPYHNAAYASWGYRAQPKDTVGSEEMKRYYLNYRMLAMEDGGISQEDISKDMIRVIVPTLILTNHGTCSSSENFLVIADAEKHIKRMGETTSGSTGNPVIYPLLPNLSCRICTKKDVFPDGREFVGIGIKPDFEVAPTLKDYLKGRDAVLQAALKQLKKQ